MVFVIYALLQDDAIDRGLAVDLARAQDHRRRMLAVELVGKGARLQAKAVVARIGTHRPAAHSAQVIPAVELQPGLGGGDLQAAAGTIAIRYTNAGAIEHTLLIDGISGFKLDVASTGATDTGTVKLGPGTYTLYCNIPGHRAAGMEAHLTVR